MSLGKRLANSSRLGHDYTDGSLALRFMSRRHIPYPGKTRNSTLPVLDAERIFCPFIVNKV